MGGVLSCLGCENINLGQDSGLHFLFNSHPFSRLHSHLTSSEMCRGYYMMFSHPLHVHVHVLSLCLCPSTSTLSKCMLCHYITTDCSYVHVLCQSIHVPELSLFLCILSISQLP